MIRKIRERETEDPPKQSIFSVRGQPIGAHKIARFERDKLVSKHTEPSGGRYPTCSCHNLSNNATENPATPSDIVCFTPEAEDPANHLMEVDPGFNPGNVTQNRASTQVSAEGKATIDEVALLDLQDLTIIVEQDITLRYDDSFSIATRSHENIRIRTDDIEAREGREAPKIAPPPEVDILGLPLPNVSHSSQFLQTKSHGVQDPIALESEVIHRESDAGNAMSASVPLAASDFVNLMVERPNFVDMTIEDSDVEDLHSKEAQTGDEKSDLEELDDRKPKDERNSTSSGLFFTLVPPAQRLSSRCSITVDQLTEIQVICNQLVDTVILPNLNNRHFLTDHKPTFATLEKLALNKGQCFCSEDHHLANFCNLILWSTRKISRYLGKALRFGSRIKSSPSPWHWYLDYEKRKEWLQWSGNRCAELEETLMTLTYLFSECLERMWALYFSKFGNAGEGSMLQRVLRELIYTTDHCNWRRILDAREPPRSAVSSDPQFSRVFLIEFRYAESETREVLLVPNRKEKSLRVTIRNRYRFELELILDIEKMAVIGKPVFSQWYGGQMVLNLIPDS